MKTYDIKVNADLVNDLNLDLKDLQGLHDWIHFLLSIEYLVRVTGGMVANAADREVANTKDFMTW